MKRHLTVSLIIVLCFIAFIISYKKWSQAAKHRGLKAGSNAKDFILGMKNSSVYRLKDLLGKYIIILAFIEDNKASSKFEELLNKNILLKRKDILWFNIKKQKLHAIIEEKTETLKIRYRTPYSNIPEYYAFPQSPSVLLIDRYGIIQLVYIGYSPTIINDLNDKIRELQ